jgi:hypothetical protein
MMKNIVTTARTVCEDVGDFVRSRIRPLNPSLTGHERTCVASLRQDGFAVVKSYWPRDKALHIRDLLERYLTDGKSRDFEEGAYLRFWDNRAYDNGVRRIYHVERLVEELGEFRYEPFVFRIAAAYYGAPIFSGVLVYQHNTQSNTNARYYHVDAFSKQFKAFLYLDDVDEGNGPFTYLRGSHHSQWVRLKKQFFGNGQSSPTAFNDRDLKALLKHEVKVSGPAGTLIVADVRGLHRGSPQVSRSRSVLMNYMYTKPGDVYLDQ